MARARPPARPPSRSMSRSSRSSAPRNRSASSLPSPLPGRAGDLAEEEVLGGVHVLVPRLDGGLLIARAQGGQEDGVLVGDLPGVPVGRPQLGDEQPQLGSSLVERAQQPGRPGRGKHGAVKGDVRVRDLVPGHLAGQRGEVIERRLHAVERRPVPQDQPYRGYFDRPAQPVQVHRVGRRNERTRALCPRSRSSSPSATSICTAARIVGRAAPNSAVSSVSRSSWPPAYSPASNRLRSSAATASATVTVSTLICMIV